MLSKNNEYCNIYDVTFNQLHTGFLVITIPICRAHQQLFVCWSVDCDNIQAILQSTAWFPYLHCHIAKRGVSDITRCIGIARKKGLQQLICHFRMWEPLQAGQWKVELWFTFLLLTCLGLYQCTVLKLPSFDKECMLQWSCHAGKTRACNGIEGYEQSSELQFGIGIWNPSGWEAATSIGHRACQSQIPGLVPVLIYSMFSFLYWSCSKLLGGIVQKANTMLIKIACMRRCQQLLLVAPIVFRQMTQTMTKVFSLWFPDFHLAWRSRSI